MSTDPTTSAVHAPTTLLRLTGPDALDVLHRISTQALLDLPTGQARPTLFCDFRGRLLHRALVARTRDGAVWLLRDDAPAAELLAHVDHHVFREKIAMDEPAVGLAVRPEAGGFGHPTGFVEERDGVPASVQLEWNFGWSLQPERSPVDPEAERDRIAAGRPRHGHEIHEAFTPYEVGLAHEVHLSKGCYTGQEVLLRLVTYASVRRRLVRVVGAGAPPSARSELMSRGEQVGVLTTVAAHGSGWAALAVVRRDALEPPVPLALADGRPTETPAPFPDRKPLGLP
jgi:folate-binding protein YgfZ